MEKSFYTIYVIPSNCPYEQSMEFAWGMKPGAMKELIFDILFPGKTSDMESKIHSKLWASWTCTGCTRGIGNGEVNCEQRKCKLGG